MVRVSSIWAQFFSAKGLFSFSDSHHGIFFPFSLTTDGPKARTKTWPYITTDGASF